MQQVKKIVGFFYFTLTALLLVGLIGSCSTNPNYDGPKDGMGPYDGPGGGPGGGNMNLKLKCNLKNAAAVGASGGGGAGAPRRFRVESSTNGDLVKIKADGSTEGALSFENLDGSAFSGFMMPPVSFLSLGDDGSVYVCFQNSFSINVGTIQFIRMYTNDTYDVLWPLDPTNYNWNTTGSVRTWQYWGMDSDPLVRGSDGKLYFIVNNNSSGKMNDAIYVYDPSTASKPVKKTPDGVTMSIDSFMVDALGHVIIKSGGNNSGSSTASWMRYYTPGFIGYGNIYYSSVSTTWVRGYIPSPSGTSLVLNGNNIRGMNGLIRVNLIDMTNATYNLLFANSYNSGWVNLIKWSGNTMGSGMELFDQGTNSSFFWNSQITNPTSTAATIPNTNYTLIWTNAFVIDSIDTNWDYPTYTNFWTNGHWNYYQATNGYAVYYILTNTILQKIKSLYMVDSPPLYTSISYFTTNSLNAISGEVSGPNGNQLTFLSNHFTGKLTSQWLTEQNLTYFNTDNFGTMVYMQDNSLYGLYAPSWWGGGGGGGSSDQSTVIYRILDNTGSFNLAKVPLGHGNAFPSLFKIVGKYLYYRYAQLDGGGQETGWHKLARIDMTTGVEEEIGSGMSANFEITSYDVAPDNFTLYVSGVDSYQNVALTYKVLMPSMTTTLVPGKLFNKIKAF